MATTTQLAELNPAQREAVERTSGPLLVLAGAGSGKTRVLTYRIAHLLDAAGVAPWNILAVTFTNKAAGEMRKRIEDLVGDEAAERLWIGTFHSVCARLLRYEAQSFGLHSDFTIYDQEDCRALVRRLLDTLDLAEQDFPPRQVHGDISRAKNAMIDVDTFTRQAASNPHKRRVAEVYAAYEQGLRANNAFDFDDLIVEPVRQLQSHPEVLDKWRKRWRHVLVDEYQDTNRPQYLLTKLLAAEHRNLCVVGDDDQSIYQFRGADIRNILDFEKDYPEAVVVRLEQNYRSTSRILAAANAVIDNNLDRKGKNLWTAGAEGAPLQVAECGDDRAEARHVVATIKKHARDSGLSLSDAAILYRTNAQSRVFEEELRRQAIPYTIIGGIRFYERREVKDTLAYLRLLVNPADDVSLLRVINTPKRGIGDSTVAKLALHARQTHTDLIQAALHADEVAGLGGRAVKAVAEFATIMDGLARGLAGGGLTLPELAQEVLERSGYLGALEEQNTPEAEARVENLGELVNSMAEFASRRADDADLGLSEFLEEVALMTSEDEAEISGGGQGTLTLMTLHGAKGLEFPFVAISGMEEEMFPTQRAIEEGRANPRAIEEERRLCYVGITRAREHLLLSFSRWRYLFGQAREMLPSRFLAEVPQELLETTEVAAELNWGAPARTGRGRRRDSRQMSSAPRRVDPRHGEPRHGEPRRAEPRAVQQPAPQGVHYVPDEEAGPQTFPDEALSVGDTDDLLAVGRWVAHPAWGKGQIVEREGSGDDTKLAIRFGRTIKRVVAAYAQLQPA